MSGWSNRPGDHRKERSRTERNLVVAAVILFLVVGGLLIGTIYGWQAIFTGLLCLLPGLAGLVLLWLLLRLVERFVDRWK